jgi:hypothetical protein
MSRRAKEMKIKVFHLKKEGKAAGKLNNNKPAYVALIVMP